MKFTALLLIAMIFSLSQLTLANAEASLPDPEDTNPVTNAVVEEAPAEDISAAKEASEAAVERVVKYETEKITKPLRFNAQRLQSYLETLEEDINLEFEEMNKLPLKLEEAANYQKKLLPEIKQAQEQFSQIKNNQKKLELLLEVNQASNILRKFEHDYKLFLESKASEEGFNSESDEEALAMKEGIQEAKQEHEMAKTAYDSESLISPKKQALHEMINEKQESYAASVRRSSEIQKDFQAYKVQMDDRMKTKAELKAELLRILKANPELIPGSPAPISGIESQAI